MQLRTGTVDDLPDITRVRTAVAENHLSVEQMAARGITHASIATAMQSGALGTWVVEDAGTIVAFAMADRSRAALWALFTAPGHEGRGHGTALLRVAESWLKANGVQRAELDTARGSRAEGFYRQRGWQAFEPADAVPSEVYLFRNL